MISRKVQCLRSMYRYTLFHDPLLVHTPWAFTALIDTNIDHYSDVKLVVKHEYLAMRLHLSIPSPINVFAEHHHAAGAIAILYPDSNKGRVLQTAVKTSLFSCRLTTVFCRCKERNTLRGNSLRRSQKNMAQLSIQYQTAGQYYLLGP